MLKEFIKRADLGECVFLHSVKAAFRGAGEKAGCRVDLALGGAMRYVIEFPRPQGTDEDAFIREYFYARIYNLISVMGGRSVTLTVPAGCAYARELCLTLPDAFGVGLSKRERSGYGKCLNVTDRINAALGCQPFQFRITEGEPESPSAGTGARGGDAAAALRRAVDSARSGRLCGMDIGGTDIKVVGVLDGRIQAVREYDWHPAAFTHIEDVIEPILTLARALRAALAVHDGAPEELRRARERLLDRGSSKDAMLRDAALVEGALGVLGFDAIGVCFPDVVVSDMIVGGETLKTRGIREASPDYEEEFSRLAVLKELLDVFLAPDGIIRMTNDGSMAAYTAAAELACSPEKAGLVPDGIFAHTLGTELGSGWIDEAGEIPQLPLEVYNCVIDLGSRPERAYGVLDLRSCRNFNTGLPGTLQKYASQSGAYRLAFRHFNAEQVRVLYEKGLIMGRAGGIYAVTEPADMRKPLLEHIMSLACDGVPEAEGIFRDIGGYLAATWEETEDTLRPKAKSRVLFGRFVKRQRVFELMREGASRILPVTLQAADDSLAFTPLMRDLRDDPAHTVAQFGQAVGAVYYAAAGMTPRD